MQKLSYPVLKYTPRFIRGGISSPKELLVVGEKNFEQGCFDDAIIIDSSGYKYRVLSAKKDKLTWDPCNLFKEYRSIWVSLELSSPSKRNLDIHRKELLNFLLLHPKWYERYDETEQSLRKELFEARTMKELINTISIYSE
ncbi:MAG: hypothetical protein VSS75_001550 [Candidatus Parabeggiatoa sp.]|nr:hypothetical protein [Candidatus Parabeggiatoa sp.]